MTNAAALHSVQAVGTTLIVNMNALSDVRHPSVVYYQNHKSRIAILRLVSHTLRTG